MLHDIDADYSPQYIKLARLLRDKIESGEYTRGDVGAENLCHLCRCPLGAVGSVPCLVRGWQVLASPGVR
jgi:hypothetical protein